MRKICYSTIMLMLYYSLIFSSLYASENTVPKQQASDTITYDTSFNGVGPKVYNLPAPKTKQQLLAEQYTKKQAESPFIISILDQQQFCNTLKEIVTIPPAASSAVKTEEELQRIIHAHQYAGNLKEAANTQNNLAILLVQNNDLINAGTLFREALNTKLLEKDYPPALIILNNLALLSRHTGNSPAATVYYVQAEEIARKVKDKTAQAYALVGLSVEKARQNQYAEAERTIIRKAIPLFKSAHNLSGHIEAFKSLAMIYEMQQKYAQASWFYLQAKGLVLPTMSNSSEMAYILFNLGHIKNVIGDYKLAVLDFKSAENIARQNNLLELQLEIQNILGDIYHKAGDYTAAVLALNEYNNLKGRIMVGQNSHDTGI